MKSIRITHRTTGTPLAEGPLGWGITPFEGNLYIRRKYLFTRAFKSNFIPGICPYKFLYVWLDLRLAGQRPVKNIGWLYWLPNPLLPFIWYRVALPRQHPELVVEEFEAAVNGDEKCCRDSENGPFVKSHTQLGIAHVRDRLILLHCSRRRA